MFLELIATFIAGFAVGGLVMLISRATGGRLPRWAVPVAAGLAMIAVTVSNEYSWFSRTSASLPDGLVIAEKVERRAVYQPWTYVVPYISRFAAVDTGTMRTHSAEPDRALADLYFFGRWRPIEKISVLADCSQLQRAPLPEGAVFDDAGQVEGLDWVQVDGTDAVVSTICEAKG